MTALPQRRRRRTLAMLGCTVLAILLVPILGYVGAQAVANSTGGKDALDDNLPIVPFPSTPTAALVTTGESGVLTGVTVLVLDPSGVGGSAISVPISADVGSDGSRQSLRDVHSAGGADATWAAIESLLVLTVNFYREAGPADMGSLLAPLPPIAVDLPQPVDVPTVVSDEATDGTELASDDTTDARPGDLETAGDRESSGTDTELLSGAVELDAGSAAAILAAGAGAEPASARQPTVEAVWAGIAAAVGPGIGGGDVAAAGAPASFDDLVARLFAGPLQTRGLSATPLTGDANPEGEDLVEIARAETLLVFGSIAPGAVSGTAPGLSFRIEAPPGYVAEVQRTIAKLLFLGGNVLSVDMTKEPQPNTVFIVPDEINRAEAGTTNMIFGEFTFQEPSVRIDGVDLTVILGTDYLDTVDVVAQ